MSTILIVDDDKLFRWALKEHLERAGFNVLEAQSVESARFLVVTKPIDAAALDYHLPDGTGIDLLKDIRDRHQDCPVAVMTAHPTDLCESEAFSRGANCYLDKSGLLDGALDRVLERLAPSRPAQPEARTTV